MPGTLDRRRFLLRSLQALGGVLLGTARVSLSTGTSLADGAFPPVTGEAIGAFGFLGEGSPPMDTLVGEGQGGRRFTDLFNLPPDGPAVGNDQFYVRTRAPAGAAGRRPWRIRIAGLADAPAVLDLAEIESLARPRGFYVMECAGNDPGGRFGLLSGAEWDGAPWTAVSGHLEKKHGAADPSRLIRVTGMGESPVGKDSASGPSWIFTQAQLVKAKAFLAVRMNGEPLSPDNGYPVRLMIPGWYGCTGIKWITELAWVDPNASATAHMRDYAARTHQPGVPTLAKDFLPALMQVAAMPVRIEKWRVGNDTLYKVVGLLWGGAQTKIPLQIRLGEGAWEDVDDWVHRKSPEGWTVWTHPWTPDHSGDYAIRLRIKSNGIRSLRLESDHYLRTCRIARP